MQADDHELKLIYTSENTHEMAIMNDCFVIFSTIDYYYYCNYYCY